MDKRTETLLEALKQALAEPGEQRLYKSGKLEGLFASRTGVSGEAATQALRDGLLEVVKTETKGKTTVEWVRLTPRGVDFLHEHESPVQALRDLQAVLQVNREKMPLWLAELQGEIHRVSQRLAEDVQRWTHRLEALSQQVESALRRIDEDQAKQDGGEQVPWAQEALGYLDRRRTGGGAEECPMPELFAAIREQQADLTVTAFQDGLRRLQDRRVVRLLPFTDPISELPEPEYALPDGDTMYYYVARA
jgi:hypothetical protein